MTDRKKFILKSIFYFLIICILAIVAVLVCTFLYTKPVIVLKGEEYIELNQNDEYIEEGATATINNNYDITDKIKIESNIDTSIPGEYEVVYSITNYAGLEEQLKKRYVTVKDVTPPVITLNGDKNLSLYQYETYTEAGATATDEVDGDLTGNIIITGDVNTLKVGTYNIDYIVTDNSGNKASTTRTVTVKQKQTSNPAPAPTIPAASADTYIKISISEQKVWFYKNNELMISSDIVTGQINKYDTPKGNFSIISKARSTYLVGPGYKSYVEYWMAFYKNDGMHDASWRNTFGGDIYLTNGSHGCVNMPFNVAKTIYENAPLGTSVEVY